MPSINRAYSWAIKVCNAPNVGYSQAYREQETVNGITYYDCSSFVNYALVAGGFSTPQYAPNYNAFWTAVEPAALLDAGFHEVPANGQYLAGDICWWGGHTEMVYRGYYGYAQTMGARDDGVPLPDQVSIMQGTWSATRLFRFGSGGAVQGLISSIDVVSAILGNFMIDSGINPAKWQNNIIGSSFHVLNHGYGLGQWYNTTANGRLWQLDQYLIGNGYQPRDGGGQIEYLIKEAHWTPTDQYGERYNNLKEFIETTDTNVDDLTRAFFNAWENKTDTSINQRIEYANQIKGYIERHINDTNINSWIAENRSLTETESLNNAVMVARFMTTSSDPVDPERRPTRKEQGKMPFYMFLKNYRR